MLENLTFYATVAVYFAVPVGSAVMVAIHWKREARRHRWTRDVAERLR